MVVCPWCGRDELVSRLDPDVHLLTAGIGSSTSTVICNQTKQKKYEWTNEFYESDHACAALNSMGTPFLQTLCWKPNNMEKKEEFAVREEILNP